MGVTRTLTFRSQQLTPCPSNSPDELSSGVPSFSQPSEFVVPIENQVATRPRRVFAINPQNSPACSTAPLIISHLERLWIFSICVSMGGISPDVHDISQLFQLDRFSEPPVSGIMCDVLWSHPTPFTGSFTPQEAAFSPNTTRGCSHYYSDESVCNFLNSNNLRCLIRAHEYKRKGTKFTPPIPPLDFPP